MDTFQLYTLIVWTQENAIDGVRVGEWRGLCYKGSAFMLCLGTNLWTLISVFLGFGIGDKGKRTHVFVC